MVYSLGNIPPTKQPVYVDNVFHEMALTVPEIVKILKSKDNNEIQNVLRKKISVILDAIFMKNLPDVFQAFCTANVLEQLVVILPDITLKSLDKEYLNKLVYDYMLDPKRRTEPDAWKEMQSYYYNLGRRVNSDQINKLIRKSIDGTITDELATVCAVARNSSSNITIATKRLHNVLLKYSNSVTIDEQMLVDIYIQLYDRVTPLFVAAMTDFRDSKKISTSEREVWSTLDLALMDILENMPSADIRTVLIAYFEAVKVGDIKRPKFIINSCTKDDYGRTLTVYEELVSQSRDTTADYYY